MYDAVVDHRQASTLIPFDTESQRLRQKAERDHGLAVVVFSRILGQFRYRRVVDAHLLSVDVDDGAVDLQLHVFVHHGNAHRFGFLIPFNIGSHKFRELANGNEGAAVVYIRFIFTV